VGTLALGFFLFPLCGSREILIGLGIGLFLLALVIAVYEQKQLGIRAAIMPCLILAVVGLSLLPKIVAAGHFHTGGKNFKLQSEQESLYGWVRVIDQQGRDLRLLTSDASTIGAASISNGQSRLTYQDIVGLIPALRLPMSRALIVGLGAGHMAKTLHDRYGMTVDTLEIDPSVAQAAENYFGFKTSGQAIVGDARYEIRHLTGPYDLIIHDCFTGGSEPAHLLTQETLTQLKNLLSDHGILALNFVAFAKGPNSIALSSVSKTIGQVLPQQLVFISEPGKDFNDFIYLASNQAIDLNSKALAANQISWLSNRTFNVDQNIGTILTDNFNPLEHQQIAKAEHYRNVIVDWFGPELLLR
jgi:spermidine synthase